MNSCPSREQIQHLLDEQLSAPEREAIEMHIEACAACQEALAHLSDEVETNDWRYLRSSGPVSVPESDADIARYLKENPPGKMGPGSEEGTGPEPIGFPGPITDKGPLGRLESLHIRRELGRGRFGVVYLAYDELDRLVAVKILKPELASSALERDRFEKEARKAAAVKHDHIVTIHYVGNTPGFPLPYLVMEYLDGEALNARLERQGVVEPMEAARIVQQMALALAAAHARGLVHRDIKPSNILLERGSGRAKLTDFGLARLVEGIGALTSQSGPIVGTPAYMSPEQVTDPQRLDGRSDLHSLGVVLYELLTGERPFRGMTHLLLEQVVHDEPRPPRKLNDRIPRDLETITLKCLAKEPGRRYQSTAELADDLQRWLKGEPIHARPVGQMERLWRWCRRNPGIASLTAAVLLLFVAGFVGVSWNYWQAEAARGGLEANLYLHRIALAHRELTASLSHPARAEELLEACPPDRRRWEWHYLKRLWRVEPVVLRDPGNEEINSVAFSPAAEHLAAACRDGTVKVWDLKSGQVATLRGHEQPVLSVAFSPMDGRRLASASADKTVRVWDLKTGRQVLSLTGRETIPVGMAQSVTFSPDGRWLAASSEGGTVRVWDATTGRVRHTLPGHELRVSVTFSPDGRLLASGNGFGIVRIWDAHTGQCLSTLPGEHISVGGLAFSPDSQRLAAGYFDRLIVIWDLTTRKPLHTLAEHTGLVLGLAFSPDGRLASASEDRTVRIWDQLTGQEVLQLRGHTDSCQGLAFSPDGRLLASASRDRTIRVWDATPLTGNEGQKELTFREHRHEVWNVAISPDGTRIASAGLDPKVHVWDATTGQVTRTFPEITGAIFSVAFSPDGRRLAAAGVQAGGPKPQVLKVWDAHTGHNPFTISETRGIFALEFSPDGRWLALGMSDGTVNLRCGDWPRDWLGGQTRPRGAGRGVPFRRAASCFGQQRQDGQGLGRDAGARISSALARLAPAVWHLSTERLHGDGSFERCRGAAADILDGDQRATAGSDPPELGGRILGCGVQS